MECKRICIGYHKIQLKVVFRCCTWRGINGCVTFVMIRSRWNGQWALIICFDGVGLKRLSALCSENPAKGTNWRRWGVGGRCEPLTWIYETCWWVLRYGFLVSTHAKDLSQQYSEVQTTDEESNKNSLHRQQCLDFYGINWWTLLQSIWNHVDHLKQIQTECAVILFYNWVKDGWTDHLKVFVAVSHRSLMFALRLTKRPPSRRQSLNVKAVERPPTTLQMGCF